MKFTQSTCSSTPICIEVAYILSSYVSLCGFISFVSFINLLMEHDAEDNMMNVLACECITLTDVSSPRSSSWEWGIENYNCISFILSPVRSLFLSFDSNVTPLFSISLSMHYYIDILSLPLFFFLLNSPLLLLSIKNTIVCDITSDLTVPPTTTLTLFNVSSMVINRCYSNKLSRYRWRNSSPHSFYFVWIGCDQEKSESVNRCPL